MFYHDQLWIYNFGISTPLTHYDCIYHETATGRGLDEVISCLNEILLNSISDLLPKFGPRTLFFVADGCIGNQFIIQYFHLKKKIKSYYYVFCERELQNDL